MGRGRHAQTPLRIPFTGWKDIAFRLKDDLAADHIGLIAAGVAFYALLALFPAITALIAIGGLMLEPSQIVAQIDNLSAIVPSQVSEIIIGQAKDVAGSHDGGLGLAAIVGIVLALYSASKGVGSLIEGLNVAYDEKEKRGFFVLKAVTLGLTVAMIVGFVIGMGATVAIPAILSFLRLGSLVETVVTGASWLVLFGLTLFGLAIIYRYGPSRTNAEWQWLSLGSVVACLGWVAASAGFAFYVGNFGSYNESFGSLAGIIILLMWLWISAFIVLFGAELNAEVEAQTRHDTTIGPDKPMGERGATKADVLGEARG